MRTMFFNCFRLKNLDVSGFKTDNVTYMEGMFKGCSGLKSLDVSGFKTDNVTSMYGMFSGCSGLTSLDVNGFKTDNVTDMSSMFYNCSGLTSLDVSGFKTDNVTSMYGMFSGCSGLTSLDVNGFKTDNVTDMRSMFYNCSGLKNLDVSGFKTDNVTYMESMFYGCSGLKSLDVSGFKTDNLTNMINLFYGCSGLTSLDVSNFKTDNVTQMAQMFSGCFGLTTIYVGEGWTTANVTESADMFKGCTSLVGGNGTLYDANHVDKEYARIDGGIDAPGYLTDINSVEPYAVLSEGNTVLTFFYDNQKTNHTGVVSVDKGWGKTITTVEFMPSFANYKGLTSTAQWFLDCTNLTTILGIENLNTENVTSMLMMFQGCSSLTSLDLSHFNTSNVTWMGQMFAGCTHLANLDVSYFNTTNVTGMPGIFHGCSSLTSIDVSHFDTSNVTWMAGMFSGCSMLTSLDLTSFKTDKVENIPSIFEGCSRLTTIYVGDGWTMDNVTSGEDMFLGCTSLVGGNGTLYDAEHVDKEYAHIDGGINNPGYFTDIHTPQPYAILSEGKTVLTFFYDNQKASRNGMGVGPFIFDRENNIDNRGWYDYRVIITSVVFDPSFAEYTSLISTAFWFDYCLNLTSITGIEYLKTANVTDMSWMFRDCHSLTSLDVSHLKTENVTDMSLMFDGCSSLMSLDLSEFNTANVTDMGGMFRGCHSLTSLDLSGFDTDKVTAINLMFYGCSGLTSLDLSGFNTTNVRYINSMFEGCSGLTSLDLSGFNTAKSKSMYSMFMGCTGLTSLDLSSFDTSAVTFMNSMFNGCSKLTTIYVGDHWTTASVTGDEDMFKDCTNLVGGNGTPYSADHINKEYARIDKPNEPGYFTDKNPAPAIAEAYAVLSEGNTVLTFFYDDKKEDWGGGMSVGPFSTSDSRPWYPHAANITSVVFDSSFAGCTTLTSTAFWFYGFSNLTSITGIEYLNTDNVKNMMEMFHGCSSLTTLDVSNFNTENVERLDALFQDCAALTSLNLIHFNTAKVTSMRDMFHGCSSLTSLDVSGFKTDNVMDMGYMFCNCSKLTNLDVSGFKTDNVTNIGAMFAGCSSLTSLDMSSFNTTKVTYMEAMFEGCSGLTTIYAGSGWTTANVISSEDMFSGCTNLVGGNGTPYSPDHVDAEYARIDTPSTPGYFTDINAGDAEPYAVLNGNVLAFYYDGQKDVRGGMSVGPFSIPSYRGWADHVADITTVVFQPSFADCTTLTSTAFWFFECPNLTTINGIENLKTPQVTNMDSMFKGCSSLTSLDVTGFDMGNVTRIDGMFYGCSSLTSLDLHNFNTSKVTSLFDLFHDCSGLTSLDLRSFDTSGVTTMEQLFNGCSSLTSLDISTFNTSKVTNMHNLFDGCSSLTSLDVSHFNTEEVTNMDAMFYNCKLLTSLDLHKFNTEKVTTMRSMFYNCAGLTSLDLSSFNTSEVTMMNFMFEGCSGLTSLDLHNFNTSKVLYTNDMFYGCANLLTLDISGFDMTNVTSLSGMFSHCSSLASIQLGNAKIPDILLVAIENPNLLVYVNSAEAAPAGIQNVVVNNEAEEIVLTHTWEGNGNFYCPKQFVAHKISYTHEFSMETVIGVSRGWETIALPFTVQSITHEVNGPLAPFGAEGGKPFWLGQMTPQGLVNAQQIVANVPYVISMPNNALYPDSYNQNGSVTFSATNCVVPMTEQHAMSSDKCTMVPTFQRVDQSPSVYAINLYDAYGSHPEGSIFVANLREVRPFEAYTLHSSGSRQFFSIDELVADPTGIQEMVFMKNDGNEKVYNLKGQRLTTPQKGLNIMNGRKVIVK